MLVLLNRARLRVCLANLLAVLLLAVPLGTIGDPRPVAAAADDDLTSAFLARLLDEINQRREMAGTQPLTYIPPDATAALDDFFAQALPALAWPGPCVHQLVDGEVSWDPVLATGFGGEARGEVLACPGPEPYWTPDRAAEEWWESPAHFEVLYADPDANALACSVSGVRGGGRVGKHKGGGQTPDAASAVLCVTFHD